MEKTRVTLFGPFNPKKECYWLCLKRGGWITAVLLPLNLVLWLFGKNNSGMPLSVILFPFLLMGVAPLSVIFQYRTLGLFSQWLEARAKEKDDGQQDPP